MPRIIAFILFAVLAGTTQGQSPEATQIGPVFMLEQTEYDLGVIGPDQNEVVGSVVISNAGDRPLEITRVLSSCQCFSEYFGDKTIAPSEEGVLFISYSKMKIPKGPSLQMAQIQTNDPRKAYTNVYFTFTVERSAEQEEQYQLYKELESLRQEIRALRQELKAALEELKGLKSQPASQPAPAPQKPAVDTTIYDIRIGDSPILGKKDAPVTIVEFGDFQCPYCVREYPKLKQMLAEYPDKVRLVFKHYPLAFHTKAKPAHAVAEIAKREQGDAGFWKIHDLIMANPKNLEPADLSGYAGQIGLEPAKPADVWADPNQMDVLLAEDLKEARKCRVSGTPTILINGLKLSDRTPEGYRRRIDEILKK